MQFQMSLTKSDVSMTSNVAIEQNGECYIIQRQGNGIIANRQYNIYALSYPASRTAAISRTLTNYEFRVCFCAKGEINNLVPHFSLKWPLKLI